MTLQVDSAHVYTSQGVPVSVTGIAQVKRTVFSFYLVFFFFRYLSMDPSRHIAHPSNPTIRYCYPLQSGLLPGFTGFSLVSLGLLSFCLAFTGFYWLLLAFTGFYLVLLGYY